MSSVEPTLQSASWAMTGFLDSARRLLHEDRIATELRLYFYAVTESGWRELAGDIARWRRRAKRRVVSAYVGTDHALTKPGALAEMRAAGINVRLLRHYNGTYHPKVMWFVEGASGHLLVGSNNLTLQGLRGNIEFATVTRLTTTDDNLARWHDAVHGASEALSDALLASYKREREGFGKARAKAGVAGTFTWSKRSSGGAIRSAGPASTAKSGRIQGLGGVAGDFIMEIMPLETGTGGSQIQVPMKAAREFFGLSAGRRARLKVVLRNSETAEERELTMTRFSNATARLVVKELDYRDRPCLIKFRQTGGGTIEFELIRESIDPDRYRGLLRQCDLQTHPGSRRWMLVE